MKTYFLQSLKALLWKCLLIRMRNYIKTTLEILIPICFFMIIFLSRNVISISKVTDSHHHTEPLSQEDLFHYADVQRILYCPNNSAFIIELMEKVAEKLDILSSQVNGYIDEKSLLKSNEELLKNNNKHLMIIFQNISSITKNINYTIRSSENYETNKVMPDIIVPGPHESYGRIYERFASLQILIDTSFIEIVSGDFFAKNILVQPFPYPAYIKEDQWFMRYNVILPFITINSNIFLALFIIGKLLLEKSSGVKQFMKTMGVDSICIWISHFIDNILVQFVITIFITALLKWHSDPLILETNSFILGLTILLYINYVIIFSFAISTFFSEALLASLALITIWIFSQCIEVAGFNAGNLFYGYILTMIPNFPIIQMYKMIGIAEMQGTGIQFFNLFTPLYTNSALSYGTILIFLTLNTILLLPIIWYMENINPGPFGVPKKPSYVFKIFDWFSKKSIDSFEGKLDSSANSSLIKETSPHSSRIRIKICNIWKIFSMTKDCQRNALENVSLNIYKGGITALLGHNGAGKTTLMSIITGMQYATKGNVIFHDEMKGELNTRTNIKEISRIIGLCPQENMTFVNLTVEENVIFFGMIKGLAREKAAKECTAILDRLNLVHDKKRFGRVLSGGTQRRLQLAIALAGNSSILILDEPTSGLDPKHRRDLWDILLELRKSHTILLSTHFLEEADILGDRIAILDHGNLKCYGTPMYLKNKICPGYKLTILKANNCDTENITNQIKSFYPNSEMKLNTKETVQYQLNSQTNSIHVLLQNLENSKETYKISSLGLSLPSIEDVFLRLCDDRDNLNCKPSKIHEQINEEGCTDKCMCINNMTINIIFALIWKKVIFMSTQMYLWVPQIILLIFLLVFGTFFEISVKSSPISSPLNMNLSIYNKPSMHILYSNHDGNEINLNDFFGYNENIIFEKIEDTTYDGVLEYGQKNISAFTESLLIAFSFNSNEYTALYSTSVYHSLPVAINLLSNVIASETFGPSSAPYITTVNYPIEKNVMKKELESYVKPLVLIIVWACSLCLGWNIFMTSFLPYAIDENVSGMRELEFLTGMRKMCYWISLYIPDIILCLFVSLFMLIILFDPYRTFNTEILSPLYALLFTYFLTMLTFTYAFSYIFRSFSSAFTYFLILNILSFAVSLMYFMQQSTKSTIAIIQVLYYILFLFPSVHLNLSFFDIAYVARERTQCMKMHEILHNISSSNIGNSSFCCERDEVTGECIGLLDYYTDPNFGILSSIYYLLATFIIFLIILFMFENKVFKKLQKAVYTFITTIKCPTDEIIAPDAFHCENSAQSALELKKLTMVYKSLSLKKKKKAIDSLNIGVNKGECFGLIGLNGAGKTTIFKLITKSEIPTTGQIAIFGVDTDCDDKEYLSSLSYCPQFDALGSYLTARQALRLFCCLRDVPKSTAECKITSILELLGIENYADIPIFALSGGSKRKVSLAVALMGLDPGKGGLILLDEPTSGVDPFSRKLLHTVIQNSIREGFTIILSSHNFDECESLCDRVGILVDGQIICNDNVQRIKKKYDIGFSLTVKLKDVSTNLGDTEEYDVIDGPEENVTDGSPHSLDNLKSKIKSTFGESCELKDVHESLLQYHISDVKSSYSSLFSKMEDVKNDFADIIETYSIYESTLEDAFLSALVLTMKQKEDTLKEKKKSTKHKRSATSMV